MSDLRTAAQQALEAEPLNLSDPAVQKRLASQWGYVPAAAQAEPVEPVAWVGDPSTQDYASTQPEPDAYGYASRLAFAIWNKHYKDTAPQWKPFDDLMGVLTQIDNMTSGLTLLAKQDEPEPMPPEQRQRWEELAAMPQQAEPAQDRHRACPTHCCPVHGCKYGHDDCPVAAGAVQPVYPRNNGCESCADEAEPLNLSDRAVQRRLAAQWGYVHDTQQALTQQKDPTDPGNDVDVLREHVRHLERRVRQLHAQQAEPVAGVVLNEEGRAALVEHGREEWHCVSRNARRLYTAPPQRKPLPKHDQHCVDVPGYGLMAVRLVRAVERAHGIKE